MFMPAPGCTTFATMSPTMSANVETVRKYPNALSATLRSALQARHSGNAGS